MSERLLPSSIIAGMLDLAAKNKIPIESLLNEVGIDPELIGDKNAHLSEEQVSAVMLRLFERMDDPAFGLRLGESVHHSIQSIAGPLFSSSENLRQAFEKLVLYQDLIIPLVELEISEADTHIDIRLEVYEGDFEEVLQSKENMGLYAVANEIIASGVWCTAEKFLSADFSLLQAGFRQPAPSYYEEYSKVFKCEVEFNQEFNYLRLDKAVFDKKLYGSLPAIHKKAELEVEQQLKKLKKSEAILNIVRDFVKEHVSDENLSLENAAKQLHMTGRTLQRALRMENTSFIEIRDSVRSELSRYYLEFTEISIEEISEKVGFSDASGFYTAFKRWHGVSPGSLRKID